MKKKTISGVLLLLFLIGCKNNDKDFANKIQAIFNAKYQHSLISKGDNFPDFNPYNDSLDYYLICLHNKIPVKEIVNNTSFTYKKIDSINKMLTNKTWLKNKNNSFVPTIFIASEKDGKFLYEKSLPISEIITSEIINFLPHVKNTFLDLELSKNETFEKWSFLLLSNVLLDSWQIDNVENEFLKAPNRPLRNGKNYYYSLMIMNDKTESFGIYGNQYEEINNKSISVYGNNRAIDISKDEQNYLSKSDNKKLLNLANDFKPILIETLNKQKEYIQKVYTESGYAEEINFEEFFIWWYHFIYTNVTNMLNKKGYLKIPESGNFYYEIEND